MPHKLLFIPRPCRWFDQVDRLDNNEAFQDGNMGGSISFSMSEVGSDWPLINYIANDAVYYNTYKGYVKTFIESYFETGRMDGIYSSKQSLLQASADAERSGYSYVNGTV